MTHRITAPTDATADRAIADYRALLKRRMAILLALALGVAGAFAMDVSTGPSLLGPLDVLRGLVAPSSLSPSSAVIVWEVRLPQALMALLVGAALSLAGAELQTILNNPMASPFTLGISSAATFGAALAIVLGLGIPGVPGTWIISTNAFVFAFGSALLLQSLARMRGSSGETIVLFGIALFFTFNALVAITQFLASEQALQQLVFWTMGSLTRATRDKVAIIAVVAAILAPLSLRASWQLTALRLGQDRAQSLGVDVARLRLGSLLRVSLLTGASVAFVGTIAFVGLVGPHIARLLVGEDHRFFLPASMLAGALVMTLASLLSKVVMPGVVMPIGLVTSLVGVPFFLALVIGRKDRG